MGDSGETGSPAVTTLKPGNEIIISKSKQPEYQQSLQIVLGTVFGVFGFLGILIVATLLYRFWKNRRHQSLPINSDRNASLHRSVSIDLEQKQTPSVLLLYSYDCAAHEKVVEALAGFLIETCNCNVHLDVFEEQIIHERGLDDWLVEKLQESEFILVLCSVGARLRCSKKKVKFKIDHNRTLPDYFAVAVDYVAEKMRIERSKGMPMSTFVVAYMDYSTASDIPPQLEVGQKFCLMRDISSVFYHLHGVNAEPSKEGPGIGGITLDTYHGSEMGTELHVAIESAKEYFKSNPDWVEDHIEQVPHTSKSKSRHNRKSSLEPLLGLVSKKDKHPLPDTIVNQSLTPEPTSQTLPKVSKPVLQPVLNSLQNRQSSFASSFSSQTIQTPPMQSHGSRSCENFPLVFSGTWSCDLCGKEGHIEGATECQGRELQLPQVYDADDLDNHGSRSKSKSMPTVYRNSLYSSQTVFQAEVHKEWDYHDGKLSQTDSQDTISNPDSVVDDLEKDLRSIVFPPQMPSSIFSHTSCDNITGVRSGLSVPMKLATIRPQLPTQTVKFPDMVLEDESDHKDISLNFLTMTDDGWPLDNFRENIQLDNIRL